MHKLLFNYGSWTLQKQLILPRQFWKKNKSPSDVWLFMHILFAFNRSFWKVLFETCKKSKQICIVARKSSSWDAFLLLLILIDKSHVLTTFWARTFSAIPLRNNHRHSDESISKQKFTKQTRVKIPAWPLNSSQQEILFRERIFIIHTYTHIYGHTKLDSISFSRCVHHLPFAVQPDFSSMFLFLFRFVWRKLIENLFKISFSTLHSTNTKLLKRFHWNCVNKETFKVVWRPQIMFAF